VTQRRSQVIGRIHVRFSGPDTESRTPAGASIAPGGDRTHTLPPSEPGRHGIAELLTLVGAIRRLAFGTLPPIEALGRIRDAFREYDDA
jgi:hypothetical protein